MEPTAITVEATVQCTIEKAWQYWISPEHITQWNNASDDWHTPAAENDFKIGGKFSYRMEARDGSFGFDFWGIYTAITEHQLIAYTMGDGRKATIQFAAGDDHVHITETFEAETENPVELQQAGWQAILNNFKKYTETH